MVKPGISLASNITRKLRRCWHSQNCQQSQNFIREKVTEAFFSAPTADVERRSGDYYRAAKLEKQSGVKVR